MSKLSNSWFWPLLLFFLGAIFCYGNIKSIHARSNKIQYSIHCMMPDNTTFDISTYGEPEGFSRYWLTVYDTSGRMIRTNATCIIKEIGE